MWRFVSGLFLVLMLLFSGSVFAADPLAAWQPKFDPSGAEYTYLLSTVGHPAIEGATVGYRIRDRVWQESNGRLYVDYRPISQLGGEKDVLHKLKMGAVQGMLCSSVLAPNVSPRLGIVNLPFLIDSFATLEKFRQNEELFREYGVDAEKKGSLSLISPVMAATAGQPRHRLNLWWKPVNNYFGLLRHQSMSISIKPGESSLPLCLGPMCLKLYRPG